MNPDLLPCQVAKQAHFVGKMKILSWSSPGIDVLYSGSKYRLTAVQAVLLGTLRGSPKSGPATIYVGEDVGSDGSSVVGLLAWNGTPLTGIGMLHDFDGMDVLLGAGWFPETKPGMPPIQSSVARAYSESEMAAHLADPGCPLAPWEYNTTPPWEDAGMLLGSDGGS